MRKTTDTVSSSSSSSSPNNNSSSHLLNNTTNNTNNNNDIISTSPSATSPLSSSSVSSTTTTTSTSSTATSSLSSVSSPSFTPSSPIVTSSTNLSKSALSSPASPSGNLLLPSSSLLLMGRTGASNNSNHHPSDLYHRLHNSPLTPRLNHSSSTASNTLTTATTTTTTATATTVLNSPASIVDLSSPSSSKAPSPQQQHHHRRHSSDKIGSFLEYVNTAQYILLLFFQQFKEQANIVLDNFASDTKLTDVTQIIDSSVFGQASASSKSNSLGANRSLSSSSFNSNIINDLLLLGSSNDGFGVNFMDSQSAGVSGSSGSSIVSGVSVGGSNSASSVSSVGSVSVMGSGSTSGSLGGMGSSGVGGVSSSISSSNLLSASIDWDNMMTPLDMVTGTGSGSSLTGGAMGVNSGSSGLETTDSDQSQYMDQFYRWNKENGRGGRRPDADNRIFEQLLAAFATVSKHSLNPTIEALYDWRVHLNCKPDKQMRDKVEEQFRLATRRSTVRQEAMLSQFTERKEVAADYIFCLALLLVLGSFHQPELTLKNSEQLENMCIDRFKKAQTYLGGSNFLVESKKKTLDFLSEIIGILSIKRFVPITDRFYQEIRQRVENNNLKYEAAHLIRGMKYVKIKLGRADHVMETVNFMKRIYDSCLMKGKRSEIKIACYEAGANILAPLAAFQYKSGTDYREWFEVLKNFLTYSTKSARKSKYYLTAYPFISTILCLSVPSVFLKHFPPHLDLLLKSVKSDKLMSLDSIIHVLGYYLQIENVEPEKQVQERLQKITYNILPGRRTIPTAQNDPIYESIVDIIVMIASKELDFAMKHMVIECLKSDFISENVLVGLKAFLSIANQADIKKFSALLDDDMNDYPPWITKLLQRTAHHNLNGEDEVETATSATVRIHSPFSSYRTTSTFNRGTSFTLSSEPMLSQRLMSEIGIEQYEEQLSQLLSSILHNCDTNFGNYLIINQTRPLHELLSKDRFGGLRVFATAFSCIPRLLPNQYSPKQLTDMICRCIIHQHRELRDVAWDVMCQLMDNHPSLRAILIHSFAEMIQRIGDFRTKHLLFAITKFLALLVKWIDNLHTNKTESPQKPTFYGKLNKPYQQTPFEVGMVESLGIILLCNLDANIRLSALQIFIHTRTITSRLMSNEGKQLDVTTVADLLDEVGYNIVKKIWRKDKFCPPTLEHFISDPESKDEKSAYYYLCDFLRELAHYVSEFCLPTANISLIQISKRIKKIDGNLDITYSRLPVSQDTRQLICLWRNFINFCCSVACKHMFYEKIDSKIRRDSREIESPEGLFDSVIKHLRCNCDIQLQAAVNALGGVRPDLLELLLERLNPLETEVALAKQKKQTKRKDILRIQLARVYARMTSIVNESKLSEKSLAIDRFVGFIDENYNYLVTPICMYNIELLSLRYNFFIIVENVARKMHYVQPFFNKLDIKLRGLLMRYSVQWTGYGDANSKRENEEMLSLNSATDKSKDAEERKHITQMYKMKTTNIKSRACYAVASLLLGEFFEPRLDRLTDWSRQTRMHYKLHYEHPSEDGDSDSEGKNSQKNKTAGKNSSIRANFPELRISLWDIGRHRSENTITVDPNESQESLAIMVLKWIDEVLSSTDRSYRRIGIQAIENMLLTNPGLLPLCIDQCYNCNARVSFGYLTAIVQVFLKTELDCSLPMLLVLVMHQSISDYTSARDDSLKLLHIISDRFFEEDAESGNYPFIVSSDLLDHYRDTQTSLAEKLAKDHSKYAQNILEEVYSRLTFLPAENQRLLLKCLEPWIAHLNLPDMPSRSGASIDVMADNIHPATEKTLDILFDLTYTYGGEFPKELEALWTKLAKEKPNVAKVVNYLVQRGTSFPASDFQKMFSISQKVSVYCASTLPQYTVNCLVTWLKKIRDISPTGQHERQLSPNVENMSSDMTQARNRTRTNTESLSLVKSDVVLILLVEIAYEHSQVFKKHLPLLLQYLFIRMDHKTSIVSNSAKLLLVHLVHSFVVRNMKHNSTDNREQEHLMAANKLIQHVLDHHNESSLWVRDKISIDSASLNSIALSGSISFFNDKTTSDIGDNKTHNGRVSKNVEQLSYLVEIVEDVFRNEENIKERWGHEALRWATRSSSLHNVVRSYQIFRTLKPELRQKDFVNMLHDVSRYLEETLEENVSEEDPNSNVSKETIKTAVTIEIIDTFRILVRHMNDQRLILFPQMFWLCAALLQSDIIYVYIHSMKLLTEILDHLDFTNDCVLSVLTTSKPKDIASYFVGLQPLVLKGLTNSYSEPFALDLIAKFTKLPCDVLFDPSDARLVMNIMSLLPLLCLSIREEDQKYKCIRIAENLAEVCEQKKLKKVAKVLLRFSKGYYNSQDKFLLDLRKPVSEAFFPQHEEAVFYFLIELLQFGPAHYHNPVLAILHSLLLYVDVVNSTLGNRERLITTTASMLKGPLWREATRVLDVAVRSGCKGMQEQIQLIYSSIPSSISKIPDSSKFKKFSSIAGEGTRTCISLIRQILQQLNERPANSSDNDLTKKKMRRQSLLMELFDNINIAGEEPSIQKENESWLAYPGDFENNFDISTLTNADLSDDTTTESSEFTDQDMTEVTDTDLMTTATSRYRLTMEDNEEDVSIRLFEEKLANQLKLFKPTTPYSFQ